MKILVIHPYDASTQFLCKIYENVDCTVITDNHISNSQLKLAIKEHDLVLMCGHGSPSGLYAANYRMMVDSDLVYLLREKTCICIWCHANEFFERYGLKGLYTGMIISEYDEAVYEKVECYDEDIQASNEQFAEVMRKHVFGLDAKPILEEYNDESNPVIAYNMQRIFSK